METIISSIHNCIKKHHFLIILYLYAFEWSVQMTVNYSVDVNQGLFWAAVVILFCSYDYKAHNRCFRLKKCTKLQSWSFKILLNSRKDAVAIFLQNITSLDMNSSVIWTQRRIRQLFQGPECGGVAHKRMDFKESKSIQNEMRTECGWRAKFTLIESISI